MASPNPTPDCHVEGSRTPPPNPVLFEPALDQPGKGFHFRDAPWLYRDLFLSIALWLFSIAIVAVVPAIGALVYVFVRYRGSANIAQIMTSDSTVLFITVLGIIPAHILTFGAAWAIVTNGGKRPFWNSLGWSFGPRFGLIPSAGLAVALYVVGSLLAKLIGGGPTDIDVLVNSTLAVRVVLAIVATFGAPIVEELVYRGIIYPSLEKVLGMAWAVAIVSFLFAFVHLLQYRNSAGVIAVIVLLGISLTLVRAFTGRLLPCVIIHAVFNGIISILIIFQPYLAQFEKGAQPKTSLVILWRMMRVFI
jgi:uncharacterized protein